MLIHPSSGDCDLFVELFHGLYCSGTMCVGVTVWFGWGGVVSLCRLKHCFTLIIVLSARMTGTCSISKAFLNSMKEFRKVGWQDWVVV